MHFVFYELLFVLWCPFLLRSTMTKLLLSDLLVLLLLLVLASSPLACAASPSITALSVLLADSCHSHSLTVLPHTTHSLHTATHCSPSLAAHTRLMCPLVFIFIALNFALASGACAGLFWARYYVSGYITFTAFSALAALSFCLRQLCPCKICCAVRLQNHLRACPGCQLAVAAITSTSD